MFDNACTELYNYWREIKGSRTAPEYGDIRPLQIKYILDNTFIIDNYHDGGYYYRVGGALVSSLYCRELHGLIFTDSWETKDLTTIACLLEAVTRAGAVAAIGFYGYNQRGVGEEFEMVLLPLGEQQAVLGGISAAYPAYWLGIFPVVKLQIRNVHLIWPKNIRDESKENGHPAAYAPLGRNLSPCARSNLNQSKDIINLASIKGKRGASNFSFSHSRGGDNKSGVFYQKDNSSLDQGHQLFKIRGNIADRFQDITKRKFTVIDGDLR